MTDLRDSIGTGRSGAIGTVARLVAAVAKAAAARPAVQ